MCLYLKNNAVSDEGGVLAGSGIIGHHWYGMHRLLSQTLEEEGPWEVIRVQFQTGRYPLPLHYQVSLQIKFPASAEGTSYERGSVYNIVKHNV